MTVLDEARLHRQRQATLLGYLSRELLELWRKLFGLHGPSPQDQDAVADLLKALVGEYADAARELATDAYLAERAAAGVRGAFDVPLLELPSDEQIEGSVRWVLRPPTEVISGRVADPSSSGVVDLDEPDLPEDEFADEPDRPRSRTTTRPRPAPAREDAPIDLDALSQRRESDVKGAASRLVAQTGRSTLEQAIDEDPAAVGWARITDANPCHFCAMLASRGFVYLSRETALFAGGTREPYHDHDECTTMPRFRTDTAPLPAANQAAQDLWYETGAFFTGTDAQNAFRRALKAQNRGGDPRAAAFDGPKDDPEKYRRLITHDRATVEEYRRVAQRGGTNGRPPNERGDGSTDPRFRPV